MNQSRAVVILMLLGAGIAALWEAAHGQSAPAVAPAADAFAAPNTGFLYTQARPVPSPQVVRWIDQESEEVLGLRHEDQKLETEVQSLLGQYAAEKDEGSKDDVREKLTEALQQQFDLRQKMRDQEITQLEEQIKRLRELFEKREAAKSKIIQARFDQLIRGAEGLGWDGNIGGGPAGMSLRAYPVLPGGPATVPGKGANRR